MNSLSKEVRRNIFERNAHVALKAAVALVVMGVVSSSSLPAQLTASTSLEQSTTATASMYSNNAYSSSSAQAPLSPALMAANVDAPTLPEAPSSVMAKSISEPASMMYVPAAQQAPLHTMVIGTGLQAQPLSAGDKVALTLKDTFSIETLAGVALSAGYSHVTNGQPNYGRNSTAFAQRFGAAAARDASEEIFSDAVFAPLLHQDPRYYRDGSQHNFFHRTAYAVTRTLVTRTDGGRKTVNASLLLGYAGASAVSMSYYPQINRNFHDGAASYGGSLAGEALYYLFSEFFNGAADVIHLRTAQ